MNSSMSHARRLAALFRRLPLHPQWLLGKRRPHDRLRLLHGVVLDVGCADRWVEAHCPEDILYIGLDYPATGKGLYSAQPEIFADATRLPMMDGSVDAVLCFEVLEHVLDHQAALVQFSRVLKPEGTLLLSMPFLYPVHDAPHDYQRLTEFGLRRDLASAGFRIVGLKKDGHAVRAAGLLTCLALVGGLHAESRWRDFILMPFAALGVLLVNLVSAGLATVLPDWNAIGTGYAIEAVKLSADRERGKSLGAERQDPSSG